MWGAQEKSGGTSKICAPPHLQIASDATARGPWHASEGAWPGSRDLTASSTYLFDSASLIIGFTFFIHKLFCI